VIFENEFASKFIGLSSKTSVIKNIET